MGFLARLLRFIFGFHRRRHPFRATMIIFTVNGKKVKKMQIKDTDVLNVAISAQDAKGNAAALAAGATPQWAVDDDTKASVSAAADGMSAVVTPTGPLGDFKVQCSIPAVGSEPAMAGELPVTVVASDATQITLSGSVQ